MWFICFRFDYTVCCDALLCTDVDMSEKCNFFVLNLKMCFISSVLQKETPTLENIVTLWRHYLQLHSNCYSPSTSHIRFTRGKQKGVPSFLTWYESCTGTLWCIFVIRYKIFFKQLNWLNQLFWTTQIWCHVCSIGETRVTHCIFLTETRSFVK